MKGRTRKPRRQQKEHTTTQKFDRKPDTASEEGVAEKHSSIASTYRSRLKLWQIANRFKDSPR